MWRVTTRRTPAMNTRYPTVVKAASISSPAPAAAPMAATSQMEAAVVSPRT